MSKICALFLFFSSNYGGNAITEVPFAQTEALKDELYQNIKGDPIAPVHEPIAWEG